MEDDPVAVRFRRQNVARKGLVGTWLLGVSLLLAVPMASAQPAGKGGGLPPLPLFAQAVTPPGAQPAAGAGDAATDDAATTASGSATPVEATPTGSADPAAAEAKAAASAGAEKPPEEKKPPAPKAPPKKPAIELAPFATPAPGQVTDDEDTDDEDAAKRAKEKAAQIECDSDAQCPQQTVCTKNRCKSVLRPIAAILYFHQKGPIGYRVVAPLYYSFWRPQKQTRVLFPLFADHQNHKEKTRDTWVFPTYQYHREPGRVAHRFWPLVFYSNYEGSDNPGKSFGIMPLFWASKRQKSSTTVIPPLLLFHHTNSETGRSDTAFLPTLTYVRKLPGDTLALFLGLGYYRSSKERTIGGFVPLVFHSRTAEQRHTAVLPLFFEGENKVSGERYMTLLPFFFYRKNGEKNRLLITPLGGSYRDNEAGENTMVMLVPPTLHHDNPVRRFTVVPPIALWYRNKENGHSFGYAGPFYYSRDEEGSSDGMFPLYFHFQNRAAKSETHVLVPLLATLHRSPSLKFGFMGPLYGWSRPAVAAEGGAPAQRGSYGGGLLPLLSFATGPRPHLALLPPVFVYSGDRQAGRYHVSVGPVFYRWNVKGPEAGYDAGLFPLLFVSRHGQSSRQMLLPLFYHHREPGHERLVLGPLYWDRRCPQFCGDTRAAVHGGLVPLVFWKRSPEHNYTVVFPLLWHVSTPKRAAVVAGPFFWSRETLPEGQGEKQSGGLFPLLYVSRSPKASLVLGPLFGYSRTEARRTLVVGPFVETVSALGRPEQSLTRAFLPLFYFHCSPGRRATVLFPLFMQVREEQTTFRSLAMLYYGVQGPKTQAHVLFPIFWFLKGEKTTTTVAGPLFYHRDRGDKDTLALGLFPLFGYGRDKQRTAWATPAGFYVHDREKDHTRAAFLLAFADIQKERSDYGFFPLFFGSRRGTATGFFVAPFFYHAQDPARSRSTTVLGPLYFGRRGAATFGGLAPLFYGRNDGDGSYRFIAVPLVYFSHKVAQGPAGPENWLLTPVFGFGQKSQGFRAYLGPLYVRRDAEVRSGGLLPLIYFGADRTTQTSTAMVLPLFFRSSSPGSSLTMVSPLFWQHRNLDRTITALAPVFLDIHRVFSSRITAFGPVVPLFVRSRDYVADTTTWLFPPLLTYVKRNANGYHNVVTFPLFYHFGGEERQTTVLFPLFYYLKRPAKQFTALLPLFLYNRDEQNTKTLFLPPLLTWARNYENGSRDRVIFPLFWHFKRPEQTTTVFLPLGAHWVNKKGHYTLVLNTYYYKGAGEHQGAWRFEFWPLIHVGRPRAQDLQWNFLSGLFGYSREGINRTLRLLWGVFIPLDPVGTKTSWYGATWRMASDR